MIRKINLILIISLFFSILPGGSVKAASPFVQGYAEGYLLGINLPANGSGGAAFPSGSITVETYDGERYIFNINEGAVFTIDKRTARLSDFKAGMEVYARLTGRQVTLLEGYSTSVTGYIIPGSKVRRGIIAGMENDQLRLKDYSGGTDFYYMTPSTLITKKGRIISPDFLYPGDRVKLYFDQVNTGMISRIEVEGDSVLINNLYKGKLKSADFKAENLILEDAYIWRNGRWQNCEGVLRISYDSMVSPFIGGQKISETRLPYYKGKEVYLLTKNILGRETAVNIILKNQYEAVFTDKIADINWYADKFELKNRDNFSMHDGSMVIKDGRLQDKMILGTGDDVLVIADGRGQTRLANIIYIYNQAINNSKSGQHYLYVGRLDQITEYRLWLKDYFLLSGNGWESFREGKEFFFDEDTSLYDTKNRSFIKPDQFIAGDYAVDEYSDRVKQEGLKDWYAYLYVNGDRVVAALLQEEMDSLLVQRITGGIVDKVENDEIAGVTVEIRDVADWSQAREQWMPKTAPIRVNAEKAMIIREDKFIMPEDLRPGERLYIVRDDFYGKVIIVK